MPAPARAHITLRAAIARLAKFYGPPPRPPATDPFELVIWENCAYLVDDARRAAVFRRLRRDVGLEPAPILAKPLLALADIIALGGMLPLRRAEKLHTAADRSCASARRRAAIRARSALSVAGISQTRSYLPACLSQRSCSISTAR